MPNSAIELKQTSEAEALNAEVADMLYASITKSSVIATFVAISLIYIESSVVATGALIAWASILFIAYAIRHGLGIFYRRKTLKNTTTNQWLNCFRFTTTCCGAAWGLAGTMLFVSNDVPHEALLGSTLAGVSADAIMVYSVDKLSALAFAGSLLALTLPTYFLGGNSFTITMACLLVLFVIYVAAAGHQGAKVLLESMALRIKADNAQKAVDALSQRQKLHIENTPLGVIEWDTNFKVRSWNAAAVRIFGYSLAEAIDQNGEFLVLKNDHETFVHQIKNLLLGLGGSHVQTENIRKDEKIIYCEWFNTLIKDSADNVIGAASLVQDKTAVKVAHDEIQRLAYYDVLTNLPNRRLLHDRLNQAQATSERNKNFGCLMYMDLDNFKALNDSKGHAVGDLLLQEVAKRLKKLIRGNDSVARISGDEFVLVFAAIGTSVEQAAVASRLIVEKVIAEIKQPYMLNGHHHQCTPSIGICLFMGKVLSGQEILKRADTSMYLAKKAGRNGFKLFEEDMQPIMDLRVNLKNDLSQAISKSQMQLYYQMQVDENLNASGAEALLRWKHPEHGMVSPGEFIPLAEESGLIIPIGTWVLQQACAQLTKWAKSPETRYLHLSVNVSALQFSQADFVPQVTKAISENACDAKLLTLELTESAILQNIEDVVAKMHALKKLGVALSMDDFGVGYSCFSVLKRLPLDELKIDQSFVQDSLDDHANATIIKSIIDLGRNIGLHVIAEGVETKSQVDFLQSNNCKSFQGYLFGRPVNIEEFELSLKRAAAEINPALATEAALLA